MPVNDEITIVSGLPRSGTSLMMKMLEAGGIEPVTDNIRGADLDNPKGYYEFEKVKTPGSSFPAHPIDRDGVHPARPNRHVCIRWRRPLWTHAFL